MARILVVDDDPDMRELLRRQLGAAKYEVVAAPDAAAADRAIAEQAPDLIIADIHMPQVTGDEFVAALRDDSRLARIPVIYLTALEADHELVVKTLGYAVIDKAALGKELLPAVRRQLRAS
jgi:CheY-like chemotaxis protein